MKRYYYAKNRSTNQKPTTKPLIGTITLSQSAILKLCLQGCTSFLPKYAVSDKNPSNVTVFLLFSSKNRSGWETVMQILASKGLLHIVLGFFSSWLWETVQSGYFAIPLWKRSHKLCSNCIYTGKIFKCCRKFRICTADHQEGKQIQTDAVCSHNQAWADNTSRNKQDSK